MSGSRIRTEVLHGPEEVARRAAAFIADEFRRTAAARGRFLLALSGGTTPWRMLEIIGHEDLPWDLLELFQVDERVAPVSDPKRNLAHLRANFLDHVPIPVNQIHPMPVEQTDLAAAAEQYAAELRQIAGEPPVLDLVHLGLGADGHTASLVPGDPAVESTSDVTVTARYRGSRRMTLTFSVLENARSILWLVTGSEKRDALERLLRGDESIPASRVPTRGAMIITETAAAGPLPLQR